MQDIFPGKVCSNTKGKVNDYSAKALKELGKEEGAKQNIQEVTERKTIENSKKKTDVENPDPVYEANPNFPGTNVHYRLYVIWFV